MCGIVAMLRRRRDTRDTRAQQNETTVNTAQTEPDPREMAGAPVTTNKTKKEKPNPFDDHFPPQAVSFKNNVTDPLRAWSDGTVPQTLADVVIPIGKTDAVIHARIQVLRKPAAGARFELMLPSSGTAFRQPMIDTKNSDDARENLNRWKGVVVQRWIEWRKSEKAKGAASISAKTVTTGVAANDEMLTELGLE